MNELVVRNRQRVRCVNLRLLRQIAAKLLTDLLPANQFEVGVYLVSAPAIARLNETYLGHAGSTDVITFAYGQAPAPDRANGGKISPKQNFAHCAHEPDVAACSPGFSRSDCHPQKLLRCQQMLPPQGGTTCREVHGEIFISVEDALRQARQFRTSWQAEVVRYVVHGWLHLNGFDDTTPRARKVMKRQENRLVGQIRRLFPIHQLGQRNSRG
ncbi:MAG: rRNA maturation RNase YbeY [Verrucomicrobia bacterium]|nr:rRNA maturation RNase YbeY [Verrucomicrobiota bacterium]